MAFLLIFHSILRWVILLVAVVAVIKFALGWLRGDQFKGMDRGLASGFSGLIDLQALLGVILLLWSGFATNIGFPMYRIEHAIAMIVAAVVAHLSARWKNVDDQTHFRNGLLVVLGTVALIFAGIASLPGGLSR